MTWPIAGTDGGRHFASPPPGNGPCADQPPLVLFLPNGTALNPPLMAAAFAAMHSEFSGGETAQNRMLGLALPKRFDGSIHLLHGSSPFGL